MGDVEENVNGAPDLEPCCAVGTDAAATRPADSVVTGGRAGVVAQVGQTLGPTRLELASEQREALLLTLQSRFEATPQLHEGVSWERVKKALEANPTKLWSIQRLEETGGEPNVYFANEKGFSIGDCADASPDGRRGLMYGRKKEDSSVEITVVEMAIMFGVELMSEEQWRRIQTKTETDTKSWSWIKAPPEVLARDKALFAVRGIPENDSISVFEDDIDEHYKDRGWRGTVWFDWVND